MHTKWSSRTKKSLAIDQGTMKKIIAYKDQVCLSSGFPYIWEPIGSASNKAVNSKHRIYSRYLWAFGKALSTTMESRVRRLLL